MHVVFKAATNPECVTPVAIVYCATTAVPVATLMMVIGILSVPAALLTPVAVIVHCAATAVAVATVVTNLLKVVVGILPVPAARFKLRVPWNATNQEKSP